MSYFATISLPFKGILIFLIQGLIFKTGMRKWFTQYLPKILAFLQLIVSADIHNTAAI